MKDVSTVWSRAAHAIETFGWVTGTLGNSAQGVCLVGGILLATGWSYSPQGSTVLCPTMPTAPDPLVHTSLCKVDEALGDVNSIRAEDANMPTAMFWNDYPGRTKEQVLELLQELHEKELAERGQL